MAERADRSDYSVHVIVISGSMGSGKTTVLGEASDILTAYSLVHAAVGVRRLLFGRGVENREGLARLRHALSGAEFVVCRLMADLETMRERVRVREPGMLQPQFLTRVTELQAVLDESRLEDFTIAIQNRAVTEVAHELLLRAGWLVEPMRLGRSTSA